MIGYWAGLLITASLALLGMFVHWGFALPVFAIQAIALWLAWDFINSWQRPALLCIAVSFFGGVFVAPAYGALYMASVAFDILRSIPMTWRVANERA